MAAKKYISQNAGFMTEVQATDSSAGAGNEGDLVALDASGKIALNMMPTGVGADLKNMTANGAISARDFVYVEAAGTIAVADNGSVGTRSVGIVQAAILDAAAGDVYFEGIVSGFTGLTPGANYYLGTGGTVVLAGGLPTATGEIVQKVGVALSATELSIEIGQAIVLA